MLASEGVFRFTMTPPASDLWIMSGETIFKTTGYPIWSACVAASFSFFARLNLVTGMPYSVQMLLASVSRSTFLPSFLAWLMIFTVWLMGYSFSVVFVYVMFGGLKMVC